jgi:transposase
MSESQVYGVPSDGTITRFPVYAGIDVCKERLDVHIWPGEKQESIRYTPSGLRKLVKVLGKAGVRLAVMEATGKLEEEAAAAIEEAGVPVAVVNAARIRHFARAKGFTAKTDPIDARVIAHFAEAMNPRPRLPKSKPQQETDALVDRRRELVGMITAEKNRLGAQRVPAVARHIKAHLGWLERELERIEKELARAVRADPKTQAMVELLDSAPGVGLVTATVLVGDLPELGQVSNKQIASLVGLAPYNRDSGKMRGKRTIIGGRGSVRQALYMAAMGATRKRCELALFYRRLVQSGKPKKLALTAVARKLLVMLNVIARRGTPWQPLCP